MSITTLKLKNAGERVTIDVKSVSMCPTGEYPEMEFHGIDVASDQQVLVPVPKSSADRQLERLGLDMESVLKRRITIKRDPNSKNAAKPYWGIYLEDGGKSSGAAEGGASPRSASGGGSSSNGQPRAESTPAPATAPNGHELYGKITAWVLREIVPMYEAGGVPMNAEAAAACVATLYIAATRNGSH